MVDRIRKMVEKQCEFCCKLYNVRADTPASRFCSMKCSGLAHRVTQDPCPICGKPKPQKRNKFCSSACAFKYRNKQTTTEIKCSLCGKTFTRYKYRVKDVNLCSRECAHRWHALCFTGQKHPRYLPIGTVRKRKEKGHFRRWVKICEPNKWILYAVFLVLESGRTIGPNELVHHIDGDSMNDSLDNLTVLTRAEHCGLHANLYWKKTKA